MGGVYSRKGVAVAIAATVMVVSCVPAVPPATSGSAPSRAGRGVVGLFSPVQGTGRLFIAVVDERPRAVQTLAKADDYQGVLFTLSNATKLKAAMTAAAPKRDGAYSAVFGDLPSDAGGHYLLTVGLYRNVAGTLSDAGYSDPFNRVGQGSATFALQPGESRTVVVTINAVGELKLSSGGTALDPTALTTGQTGITLDTGVNSFLDPEADRIAISVVSATATESVDEVAMADWPAPPATVTRTLQVPTLGSGVSNAGFTILVDLYDGATLLSRRSQAITVSSGATPAPSPTPEPTPTPTPEPTPTPTPEPTPTPTPEPTPTPTPDPTPTPSPTLPPQCTTNSQCSNPTPKCVNNECTGCTSNSDCNLGDLCVNGSCTSDGGCLDNSECSGVSPYCEMTTHQCVQCLNSENCEDPFYPICDNGECVDGG